jgi:Nuclease-related domain
MGGQTISPSMPEFLSMTLSHVVTVAAANLPYLILAASISLLLGALWLWRAQGSRAAQRVEELTPLQALLVERAGRKGEDAVAAELARLELPNLRNVIITGGAALAEIDHIVRTRAGIVVLETKSWSGFVMGELDGAEWWQHRPGAPAPQARYNPVLQNQRHVRVVVNLLAGLPVAVRGYVVGAGSARFNPALCCAVVSLGELETALMRPMDGWENPVALDEAWRRLTDAAMLGAPHRAAQAAFARNRRLAVQRR